ncbi:MAG: hypothetical protein NVV57_10760 [Demequina sp.]|nr:hypothetical protein [Demequina sp.]
MPNDEKNPGFELFNQILAGDGASASFLKCHLILESFLEAILEDNAEDASALGIGRMSFAQKVNVCAGFGFVSHDEVAALRAVNRVRNSMAHTLHFEITAETVADLEGSLAGVVRAGHDGWLQGRSAASLEREERIRGFFLPLVMVIGFNVLKRRFEKAHLVELESYRLAAALSSAVAELGSDRTIGTRTDEELRDHFNIPDPPNPGDVFALLLERWQATPVAEANHRNETGDSRR